MKVLEQEIEVADHPFIKRVEGGWGYLHGVTLPDGRPVYRNLLRVWTTPGLIYFEVKSTLVILAERRPYIRVECYTREEE